MGTEINEFEEAARARKVNTLANSIHAFCRRGAMRACSDDPSLTFRVEQAVRLSAVIAALRGKNGAGSALAFRDQWLREAGLKSASPRTWKLLLQRLDQDHAMLASTPCEGVFDERGTR